MASGTYGRSQYGQSTYGNDLTLTGIPIISGRLPAVDSEGNEPDVAVRFSVTDWNEDINLDAVSITINNRLAYDVQADYNGFITSRVVIPYGYQYSVASPLNYAYGSLVQVYVTVRDADHLTVGDWSFRIRNASRCFEGPLNSFELRMLEPYTGRTTNLYYMEQLRTLLLEHATSTPDPIEAVRSLYLRAHSFELGTVLRDIVPSPTSIEKDVILCYRRTILQIHADLQRKPGLLTAAMGELPSVGVPVEYLSLLVSYANTNDPNVLVPLACLMVLLAKTLEDNELV